MLHWRSCSKPFIPYLKLLRSAEQKNRATLTQQACHKLNLLCSCHTPRARHTQSALGFFSQNNRGVFQKRPQSAVQNRPRLKRLIAGRHSLSTLTLLGSEAPTLCLLQCGHGLSGKTKKLTTGPILILGRASSAAKVESESNELFSV